jgi:hypothetical protein
LVLKIQLRVTLQVFDFVFAKDLLLEKIIDVPRMMSNFVTFSSFFLLANDSLTYSLESFKEREEAREAAAALLAEKQFLDECQALDENDNSIPGGYDAKSGSSIAAKEEPAYDLTLQKLDAIEQDSATETINGEALPTAKPLSRMASSSSMKVVPSLSKAPSFASVDTTQHTLLKQTSISAMNSTISEESASTAKPSKAANLTDRLATRIKQKLKIPPTLTQKPLPLLPVMSVTRNLSLFF